MERWINRVHIGDCLETLRRMPDGFVQTCVTSPPYFGLRDYGHDGQIGLEPTPEEFIDKLVAVFREVRRVLRDDGTCWVNMGDSYARNPAKGGSGPGGKNAEYGDTYSEAKRRMAGEASTGRRVAPPSFRAGGAKEKDLLGVPWMLAFALRADGWYLRQDIIWNKPNPLPESVEDRCTKAHEYVFLLSKSGRYYFDFEAIKEPAICAGTRPSAEKGSFQAKGEPLPGQIPFRAVVDDRRKRSVWTVATKPYAGAHFATYPEELIEPCILAGSPAGGVVLDPFFGSGTTGAVAQRLGRKWVGCELNPAYGELHDARLRGTLGLEL